MQGGHVRIDETLFENATALYTPSIPCPFNMRSTDYLLYCVHRNEEVAAEKHHHHHPSSTTSHFLNSKSFELDFTVTDRLIPLVFCSEGNNTFASEDVMHSEDLGLLISIRASHKLMS